MTTDPSTRHAITTALQAAAEDVRHYAKHCLFDPDTKTGMLRAADVIDHHAAAVTTRPADTAPRLAPDGKPRIRLFRFPANHPQHPGIWAGELPDGWYAKGWFPSIPHHTETGRYAYPFNSLLHYTYPHLAANYFRKDIQKGHHS